MANFDIHLGNNSELITKIPDGTIDAIITDPPYMVTDLKFDKNATWVWLEHSKRVVKGNGYLAVFGMYDVQKIVRESGWSWRFDGCWLKGKGGMKTHSTKKPRMQSEMFSVYAHPDHTITNLTWNEVIISGAPYSKVNRNTGYIRDGKNQIDRSNTSGWTSDGYVIENNGTRVQTNVVFAGAKSEMKHAERTTHPTQKPIELMRVIVQWLTNKGDTVLDVCMGSGSTGVACLLEERNFVGFEINDEYFQMAKKRLDIEKEEPTEIQLELFLANRDAVS